jgi:plasmid maintenance system killer protein
MLHPAIGETCVISVYLEQRGRCSIFVIIICMMLTRDHDACMTPQISEISRSTRGEADVTSLRSKIDSVLSSESSSSSPSDHVHQIHTDVDASDGIAASIVANIMKRFQMISTGKTKRALHCPSLHFSALQYTTLHYTALQCAARCFTAF